MDKEIFYSHLKKYLNGDEIALLRNNIENEKSLYNAISVDINKISIDNLLKIYPSLIPHPVCKNCFIYNKEELDLGKSLLFEMGAFYIFEPCSPIVSELLNLTEDDLLLDMCASPGGKSIHASIMMNNKGLIISNELSKSRADVLSSNIEKYGRINTIVISEDANDLKKEYKNTFSKIILDAPCSGSGMFKKEPKMMLDWTIEKMKSLTSIQKELILSAYEMLMEGGEMVYSTCSFSYEEDEEVIKYLLENTDAELINIDNIEGAFKSDLKETIHLFPHLFKGEGHFIAKIKKPGELKKPTFRENNKLKLPFSLKENKNIIFNKNNDIYITTHPFNTYKYHVLRSGIKVGSYDKKIGIIYDHAYSRYNDATLNKIDLSFDEAIDYIYGLPIKKDDYKGYVILTHNKIPFAISKASNGLLKNHYPKGLRKKITKND